MFKLKICARKRQVHLKFKRKIGRGVDYQNMKPSGLVFCLFLQNGKVSVANASAWFFFNSFSEQMCVRVYLYVRVHLYVCVDFCVFTGVFMVSESDVHVSNGFLHCVIIRVRLSVSICAHTHTHTYICVCFVCLCVCMCA